MNPTAPHSQQHTSVTSDSLVTTSTVTESNTPLEWLRVVDGEQSGVTLDIASKHSFSVGTDFSNDVVLRNHLAGPTKFVISKHKGKRRIQLQQGHAWAGDTQLPLELWHDIKPNVPICFAEVSFLIEGNHDEINHDNGPTSVENSNQKRTADSTKRTNAIAALVGGIALLGVMGAQEYWATDAHNITPALTLEQKIAELDLGDLKLIDSDTGEESKTVQGRVDGRDDFRKLQQMLSVVAPTVSIDVQIDSDIKDALHDIFRNHGIEAKVDILGKGHVRVESDGVDEPTMQIIEQALQADLPMLNKLDIVNTPPEEIAESSPINPEKEIEAVVEGAISYVITRDQARYFIGAILPSGHTIESIEDGTVVMLRAGETTQLKF